MPSNFQWISNDSSSHDAYITIDKQLRLYVSSKGRKLFGYEGDTPFEMYVGYDSVNKRLVFGKVDVNSPANVKPFKFDKRAYASARPFISKAEIPVDELPLRYGFVGRMQNDKKYPSGTYLFQLDGYDAPDGGLWSIEVR